MSLRRICPQLISRCSIISRNNNLLPNRLSTTKPTLSMWRAFSSPPSKSVENKMTAEEVEAALEKANQAMASYYSYPPDKVIAAKKLKFNERHRNKDFYLQLALGE